MNTLSIFSGLGAFDYGVENAGWDIVGQIEIDEFCQNVLYKHWPLVPKWKDVKNVSGESIRRECGRIDAIIGGPPCQSASVAGDRRGCKDDRWLWPEYLRLVREVDPVWVLAENPCGILTLEVDGIGFRTWLAAQFQSLGYEVWAVCIAAEDIGAPHKRERVWFIARRCDRRGVGQADSYSEWQPQPQGMLSDQRRWLEYQSDGVGQANAMLSEWRPEASEADERDRANGRREEAAGRFELCGHEAVADAPCVGQREPHHQTAALARQRTRQMLSGRSDGVRELENSQHCRCRCERRDAQRRGANTACASSERDRGRDVGVLGDANVSGLSQHPRFTGDARTQLAAIIGTGWPARPGEQQYAWEVPRITFAPLDPTANGSSRRLARWRRCALTAIGNACLPQIPQMIAMMINELEEQ